MSRNHRLFLADIVQSCERLLAYRSQIDWGEPESSQMAIDAVLYNMLILGEATKNLPSEAREAAGEIEWRKIAAIRDVLAHGYFRIDLSIIRDVLETRLQALQAAAERLLDQFPD